MEGREKMRMARNQDKGPIRNGWVAIALFAALVALLGGSSRTDAIQIVALRPIGALFLVPALYLATRDRMADVRGPLLLMLALMAWMAIQLIPLPPGWWHALPGREPVVQIGAAIGLPDVWRPISMVPMRTLNALVSLIIPLAGLLLAAATGVRQSTLLLVIVGLGVANTAMGILQILGGVDSPLYFYHLTGRGAPVGIFANENHSAVFGAISLLVIGYLLSMQRVRFGHGWRGIVLPALFLFVLIGTLMGGSRAGLLTAFLALVASGIIFWAARFRGARGQTGSTAAAGSGRSGPISNKAVVIGLFAIAIIATIVAFGVLRRPPALDQMAEVGDFEDFRFYLWPVLWNMVQDFWLLGSGFGSFEGVYHIYEPTELLFPFYVNQAHNDWAQLLIEGGLPAVLILIAAAGWVGRCVLETVRHSHQGFAKLMFWGALFTILGLASAVDYPLRTPLFQLLAVWLLVALQRDDFGVPGTHRHNGRGR